MRLYYAHWRITKHLERHSGTIRYSFLDGLANHCCGPWLCYEMRNGRRARRASQRKVHRKRLSNTPVLGKGFVLKFSDERRTEGFSTQTTYTRGSSGVGGGIHEQRHAAKRVLQESRFELRYAESPREQAALEE